MYSHKGREIKIVERHINFYSAECVFEVTAVNVFKESWQPMEAQKHSAHDPS